MKRSDIDKQLQTFNDVQLTKEESAESYQKIMSRVRVSKRRKSNRGVFNRTITAFATIIVLIVTGLYLNDVLNPSLQQGDKTPPPVEDERGDEEEQPEDNVKPDDSSVKEERTKTCVDSAVEPTSNSVAVYFECQAFDEHPYPVKAVLRDVESGEAVEDRIEYAIQELLKGPTTEEMDQGFGSIFNEETAGLVNRIELQNSGHLIVDFVDFSKIIPNGSASTASSSMMETLDRTISQFPEVRTIEYRFDGSCDFFFEWLQVGECIHVNGDDFRDFKWKDTQQIKEQLMERSEVVFNQLMNKEWKEFASHIHEERGFVYSPFSNVGDSDDLHFTQEEVQGFGTDDTEYSWSWDQSGAEFMATPNDFVEFLLKTKNNYVYDYDEINYNYSDIGTHINTIHEVYPNALYVEYLDEPDVNSIDWYKYQALRFVYEKIGNEWYLIAVVRAAYNP